MFKVIFDLFWLTSPILAVLKLIGYLNWSWWAILAPLLAQVVILGVAAYFLTTLLGRWD